MKLLIIHDLPSTARLRRQTINQSFFYPKYRPGTEMVLHGVGEPFGRDLTEDHYDAIFLDPTLLAWRWARPRGTLSRILETYSWVANHSAPKFAFPQDDYDHQAILDDWLFSWNVDVICTPLATFKEVLYPKSLMKARIEPFLTGFIDDIDLKIGATFGSNLADRDLDVVYRARPLPANFGRLGQLKTVVAEMAAPKFQRAGFRTNISTDPSATIFGGQWLTFLGSSKYVLGSPSGSSVLDPVGEIGDCVAGYVSGHAGASFEEIYGNCVPDSAARHWMAAISPRCLEAALTRTCQVLVRGEYGPLEANRHYIAIEPDLSNLDEVVERMRNVDASQRMADACYELVTTDASLHYRHAADIVDRALERIHGEAKTAKSVGEAELSVEEIVERQIWSRLTEKQRLIRSAMDALGRGVTDDPIEVARFSEAIEVVGDRWHRLQRGFQEVRSEYKAYSENSSKHIELLQKELHEVKDNYISISSKYEALYTRPRALFNRMLEIFRAELLRKLK